MDERPHLDIVRYEDNNDLFYMSSLELRVHGKWGAVGGALVEAKGKTVDEVAAKMCAQLLAHLEKRLDRCRESGAFDEARRIQRALREQE